MRRHQRLLHLGLISLSIHGLSSQLHADAAIGLYNPFNHGLLTFVESNPIDELREDRVDIIHNQFFPVTGFIPDVNTGFIPFYAYESDRVFTDVPWNIEDYPKYTVAGTVQNGQLVRPPTRSASSVYSNLHIFPDTVERKFGVVEKWAYFDPMKIVTSDTAGSGLSGTGGNITLKSSDVDTGFGTAIARITPEGDIKLRVDIENPNSTIGGTPVAEAALQATLNDTFILNLATGEPVSATLTASVDAIAPILDFSKARFYSYGVGFQASVFRRTTFGDTELGQFINGNPDFEGFLDPEFFDFPAIEEYWSASGFYWMDARMDVPFGPLDPYQVRIESLGLQPPDMPGVTESKAPLAIGTDGEGDPVFNEDRLNKYIREFEFPGPLLSEPEDLVYDDPMMPFKVLASDPNILLPTNTPLEIVVNFFVQAGVGREFIPFLDTGFFIDGSNTASVGIQINDPNVQLVSSSGFDYRQVAVGIPETSSLVMTSIVTVVLGGWAIRKRAMS